MPEFDVLVIGAHERQGLAVIRSLGRKDLRVLAAGPVKDTLGAKSRYAAGSASYPPPSDDAYTFCKLMRALVDQYEIQVVMPTVERAVIALDQYRDLFGKSRVLALASSEALTQVLDKKQTYSLAGRLGIRAPESCYPRSVAEGLAFARRVGYPVVIKPRGQSLVRGVEGDFDFKVRYFEGEHSLRRSLEVFERDGAFPVLQEYCGGIGVAHSFLVVNGSIRGLHQHRREREYPLTGGVASVIVSEPVDEYLEKWTQDFVSELRWDGIGQVEYRHDRTSDERVLIEFNGRFWAPLSGAIQLGLDFPFAWYKYLTTGDEDVLPKTYPIGRRTRYLRGDLRALKSYFSGDVCTFVRPLPSKQRIVWQVLRDFTPSVDNDIASLSDWRPGCHEACALWRQFPERAIRKSICSLARKLRN